MDTETEQRFISIERHNQETDKHLTMLLGIARDQERDLRTIQADVSSLKEDVAVMQVDLGEIKERLGNVEIWLERVEGEMHTGFAALDSKLDSILARLPEK